jgi:hypothetical protein
MGAADGGASIAAVEIELRGVEVRWRVELGMAVGRTEMR